LLTKQQWIILPSDDTFLASVERRMMKDQDVAADMDGDVRVEELLPNRIRLARCASLNRRPGISKVLRELRIEFDQR
jgi:hypothetical protein